MFELPDWPEWTLRLMIVMSALLLVTLLCTSLSESKQNAEKIDSNESKTNGHSSTVKETLRDKRKQFKRFRAQYLTVYLIVMLADWMQGTHMYTLYLSYGVNVAALFLTGFLSGAMFAPFLGSAVDKFGRKKSCCIYCILEIIINTLEHSTNFKVLILGRIMGGVSTNLLFSAFESWMTTEHRKQNFPDEWLPDIYSVASVGNGVTAVLAGIIAQLFEDRFGPIGPFQAVIVLTFIALFLIFRWEENYGDSSCEKDQNSSSSSLRKQFIDGWKTTCSDSRIWRIGLTQALSEGAMYTFVFMWVPTLYSLEPPGGVPTGVVFSAMMISITIGGILFTPFHNFCSTLTKASSMELSAALSYVIGSVSMIVPAICIFRGDIDCLIPVLSSFMVVEACVGLFMPAAGSLRSKYVPDSMQGAILNIFRLPLNIAVVSGTYAADVLQIHEVFLVVSCGFLGAAIIQATMISSSDKTKVD